MNTKQFALTAVMIFATATFSQAQIVQSEQTKFSAADKHRIEQSLVRALSTPNNGVVNSALAIAAKLKLDHPTENFSNIMQEVSYLAEHSKVPMIRYRASLTEAVYNNPVSFKQIAAHQSNDQDTLFTALDDQMTAPTLSAK
ncbi:MAG TPA: hypothetical protein VK470_01355 [Bacteroidota bacterium]|nr:hypothetical protein [Bacteroidota bacterium]